MPKRQSTKRIPTPDLQPPDGWVEVKQLTVAQAKALQKASDDPEEVGRKLFAEFVIGWNWGDEDGNPLPQPHNNPEVFEALTPSELRFLANCLGGFADEKKV